VPSVRDHKNALLLRLAVEGMSVSAVATLQHALLRGIESVFQLEEGEILAENPARPSDSSPQRKPCSGYCPTPTSQSLRRPLETAAAFGDAQVAVAGGIVYALIALAVTAVRPVRQLRHRTASSDRGGTLGG